MKRKTITSYINEYFEDDSKPTRATVIRWIINHHIAGEKIGGTWYVYPEKSVEDQQFQDLCTIFDNEVNIL